MIIASVFGELFSGLFKLFLVVVACGIGFYLYLLLITLLGYKLRYFIETKILGNDLPPLDPLKNPFRRK